MQRTKCFFSVKEMRDANLIPLSAQTRPCLIKQFGGVIVNQADHHHRARVMSLVRLLDACKAAVVVQLLLMLASASLPGFKTR